MLHIQHLVIHTLRATAGKDVTRPTGFIDGGHGRPDVLRTHVFLPRQQQGENLWKSFERLAWDAWFVAAFQVLVAELWALVIGHVEQMAHGAVGALCKGKKGVSV